MTTFDRRRANEIDEILRTVEPKFQRAFEEGLKSVQAEVSLNQIATLIEAGNLEAAAGLINELLVATSFITFNREIQAAVQAGGDIAAKWAAADPVKANRIVFDLDVTESNTSRFITNYKADKIREFTAGMQANVGEMVRAGVNAGENPRKVARRIRDSIGLTSKQEQSVRNFETLLRDRKSASLDRALRDKRFDRTVIRSIQAQKDLTEPQITRMVERYRSNFVKRRSETIARTEAIRLINIGQEEFWNQAVNSGRVSRETLRRKWIPTLDGRLREAHAAIPRLNPDGVDMDEPFKSPLGPIRFPGDPTAVAANVINCFHPDTLIFNLGIKAVISRRYVGDMIKISVTNSVDFSVTPNHPILTKRGWIAAGELMETDNLVNCNIGDFSSGAHPNINQAYSTAESIHDFYKVAGSVVRTTGSGVDLHGEIIPNSDVEIVALPCFLMNTVKPTGIKFLDKIKLKHTNINRGTLFCKSILSGRFGRSYKPSFSNMGFFRHFSTFLNSCFSHAKFISFTTGSNFKPYILLTGFNKIPVSTNLRRYVHGRTAFIIKLLNFIMERFSFFFVGCFKFSTFNRLACNHGDGRQSEINNTIFDHLLSNTKFFTNCGHRFTRFVKLFNSRKKQSTFFKPVRVASISKFHYDGPVYNFETNNGLIIAHNIVTHNCRCAVFTRIRT